MHPNRLNPCGSIDLHIALGWTARPRGDVLIAAGAEHRPSPSHAAGAMTTNSADTLFRTVTLANWRQAPHSTWAFHNVDALVPVERIAPAARPWPLAADPRPIDAVAFTDAEGRARRLDEVLEATCTRGLVVLHHGRIVAERYGQGYDGTRPHILFSLTKSVAGVLAGILADRGALDPDRPVTDYVPEVAASAYGDCAVRHLLDMTVSAAFEEDYFDTDGDHARYRRAMLWNPAPPGTAPETLHGFLATLPRGPEPHGTRVRYLSPNADLLGWVLERAGGRRFADLLEGLIWQPMGAEAGALLTVDAAGAARSSGGLCALPRDLARFGEMLRRGGVAQGGRVVPAGWVDDIRRGGDSGPWQRGELRAQFPQGRYRSLWYQVGNPSGAFCAIGIHGQRLWIDPAREVVIAKVSALPEPDSAADDRLLIHAFEALAAAL